MNPPRQSDVLGASLTRLRDALVNAGEALAELHYQCDADGRERAQHEVDAQLRRLGLKPRGHRLPAPPEAG